MIDTDKYEGHDNWEGTKVNMANEANKLLIADAPLLLEEVKRLREAIDTLHIDDLDGTVTLFKSTDEGTETIAVFDEEHREVIEYLVKQVKRLREEVYSLKRANDTAWALLKVAGEEE